MEFGGLTLFRGLCSLEAFEFFFGSCGGGDGRDFFGKRGGSGSGGSSAEVMKADGNGVGTDGPPASRSAAGAEIFDVDGIFDDEAAAVGGVSFLNDSFQDGRSPVGGEDAFACEDAAGLFYNVPTGDFGEERFVERGGHRQKTYVRVASGFGGETGGFPIPVRMGMVKVVTVIVKLKRQFTASLLLALPLSARLISGQMHISAYDTPSIIDFESTEVTVSENSTNVTLHVFRTGEFRTISRVDFQTVEETATEGTDYQGKGGTLVFQPGEGYKTVTIPIMTDELEEGAESFRLELSTADERVILARPVAAITIEESTNSGASVPQLAIEAGENGTVILSWSQSARNLVLESAVNCGSPDWQEVPSNAELKGPRYELAVLCSDKFLIFRLRSE